MQEIIFATRKNHLACHQSLFLQKNVSQVAAHPIKVDKCGGEIAKLATSSHKKAIETSEEKISCKMLVVRTPFR